MGKQVLSSNGIGTRRSVFGLIDVASECPRRVGFASDEFGMPFLNQDRFSFEEFDPGSERTLAAGFRHASRARKSSDEYSGVRVSNG